MSRCDECGFDEAGLGIPDVASTLRAITEKLVEDLMSGDDDAVRMRPEPSTWSMLEYCCHVRDTLLVQRERVLLALVEDRPRFVPMYRDERVINAGYEREARRHTGEELAMASHLLIRVVEGLDDSQLAHRCFYNFPQPAERDVAWVIRHTVHEVVHHEMDVRRVRTRLLDEDTWD